jgi:hypothetical protein
MSPLRASAARAVVLALGVVVSSVAGVPDVRASVTSPAQQGRQASANAIGTGSAFMSISPSIVPPQTAATVAVAASGFAPGEDVLLQIDSEPVATYQADTNGRLALSLNSGPVADYVIVEAFGGSSGALAGGVYAVASTAPVVPGVAIAPHAIKPTGDTTLTMVGVRYQPNTNVTLYRNGVTILSVTTDALGHFKTDIPVAANTTDTSAVYSAGTDQVGSLVGQSIEERSDADFPPIGYAGLARAHTGRGVISTSGQVLALMTGEGFKPGEEVHLCGNRQPATSSGAAGVLPYLGSGASPIRTCSGTGWLSRRRASASVQVDARAAIASTGINMPSTVRAGGSEFTFLFLGAQPWTDGKIYINDELQGTYSNYGSGEQGAMRLTAPTEPGVYAVRYVGDTSGRLVIAPLFVGGSTGFPCQTPPFSDVGTAHTFCPEIEWMKFAGVSRGFTGAAFRPADVVTRQAMSAFLARQGGALLRPCETAPFNDVPTSHPFCEEIQWMKETGISTGFPDGTYAPSAAVTRQAMSAFLARFADAELTACVDPQPFPDVPENHPFCPEILWMKTNRIASNYADGKFHPSDAVTRQAMAAFLYRFDHHPDL